MSRILHILQIQPSFPKRYEYPFLLWVAIAITWCTLVCCRYSKTFESGYQICRILLALSLLKVYVKTLIMDPKQLEPFLQPNVHGHAYFGWHCWRPPGCLWSSLFPHTTRYSTSTARKLTKVIFQNKFSDTLRHFQLTQLTSSSCPRLLLPRSQSFSLFWWASANWPMMTTSLTINIFW